MAKHKEHMNKHLASAKKWVSRAEESFETEKDIRGELDLFLAQAELAHVQKTSRIRRLSQSSFFKQGAALFVAIFAVTVGLGINYWLNTPHFPAQPSGITSSGNDSPSNHLTNSNGNLLKKTQISLSERPENILPQQSNQALKLPNKTPDQPPVLTPKAPESLAVPANARLAPQPERPDSPAPVLVSQEQMQNLIRSAGNSLRDRE